MRPQAAVVADDLTGALDTGLQAWRLGVRVRVLMVHGGVPPGAADAGGLLVLDTESRALEQSVAAGRVRETIAAAGTARLALLYKKVDSTLRGNIGAEIGAVLASGAAQAVLLAPTLPAAGRVVRGGIHYVDGVELACTEMRRDPLWPMRSSSVAEIVAAGTALASGLVPLSAVRGSPGELLASLGAGLEGGVRILIGDAETEDDLRRLAEACERLAGRLLPCGSAGLFAHLARALPEAGQGSAGPTLGRGRPPAGGALLVVSASTSAVTRRQIDHAAAGCPAVVLSPEAGQLFGSGEERAREIDRLAGAVAGALARGTPVILDAARLTRADLHTGAGVDPEERRRRASTILAAVSAAVRSSLEGLGGLVTVGGDTAVTVCRAAGAYGVELTGVVEPLLPRGIILGGPLEGIPVATKAGGFGGLESISRAMASVQQAMDEGL